MKIYDSQIIEIIATKKFDDRARTEIKIEEVGEDVTQ